MLTSFKSHLFEKKRSHIFSQICHIKYYGVYLLHKDGNLCFSLKQVQISLAIRGGYVQEKSQTANNKTGILGPN